MIDNNVGGAETYRARAHSILIIVAFYIAVAALLKAAHGNEVGNFYLEGLLLRPAKLITPDLCPIFTKVQLQ